MQLARRPVLAGRRVRASALRPYAIESAFASRALRRWLLNSLWSVVKRSHGFGEGSKRVSRPCCFLPCALGRSLLVHSVAPSCTQLISFVVECRD
jgi:hypothetical protein